MKTLIGIVTFGNLPFTQLTINEIRRTTRAPFDFLVVVGQPGDHATAHWLEEQDIPHLLHHENRGFPASLNDIWAYAWEDRLKAGLQTGYDNVILCGNDVVPYPGAIDALIAEAARGKWEWICASQFDVKALCAAYPEQRAAFLGDHFRFEDFTLRPWDAHAAHVAAAPPGIEPHQFKDVQNLCLYRRSVFERMGYFDANFWPNGYFSDNDAARRAVNLGLRGCGLPHAVYFHFWSRTIHQGLARRNEIYFQRNEEFYLHKWGGPFGAEKFQVPFDGGLYGRRALTDKIFLPASLKIGSRADDGAIANYWREKAIT